MSMEDPALGVGRERVVPSVHVLSDRDAPPLTSKVIVYDFPSGSLPDVFPQAANDPARQAIKAIIKGKNHFLNVLFIKNPFIFFETESRKYKLPDPFVL